MKRMSLRKMIGTMKPARHPAQEAINPITSHRNTSTSREINAIMSGTLIYPHAAADKRNYRHNDWTYGKQRHFEINAVVGHTDSATKPSHFTAENDNGEIIVIELPGGNVTKAKMYQIETIPTTSTTRP